MLGERRWSGTVAVIQSSSCCIPVAGRLLGSSLVECAPEVSAIVTRIYFERPETEVCSGPLVESKIT